MSDPGKYRTKEEAEEMMRHDPILLFEKHLQVQFRVAPSELEGMDKDVLAQVDEEGSSPWTSSGCARRSRRSWEERCAAAPRSSSSARRSATTREPTRSRRG